MNYLIVSDLHLNMGKPGGKLHPLEDYDCDDEFSTLLAMAQRDRAGLIINGDWVDFLQLEPFAPLGDYHTQDGIPLGWTADRAQAKLATCLAAHKRHFDDLAAFLRAGGSLTVMQGNHDPDWFFPAEAGGDEPPVQKQLRQALGSTDRDALRFVETSIRLAGVHVEHGHQLCEFANAFQDHPRIFHADRISPLLGRPRFELLWGSRFVLEFFNDLETKYPFADNLKPTIRALVLGIGSGWVNGATAADVLRFLCGSGLPWRDAGELLDTPKTSLQLIQGLQDDELKAMFFERWRSDPVFQEEVTERLESLPQEEKRALDSHSRSDSKTDAILPQPEAETLGLFRATREFRNAKNLREQPGVCGVIFGHTHQEIDGNDKDAAVAGYFNTGTWIPRFDLRKPENRALLESGRLPIEILADRRYFELRLMYAEVELDGDTSKVALKEMPPTGA